MASLDQIIFDELKELMDGDIGEIVELYINDSREQIAQLKTSVDGGDIDGMVSIAHTLKSSSANLGAMQLADMCEKMENDGRNNSLKNPASLLSDIVNELSRVEDKLNDA